MIAFVHDLSERQQLERERHERQQFFDLASEIFLILDGNGRVLQANRRLASCSATGDEMAGHRRGTSWSTPIARSPWELAAALWTATGRGTDLVLRADGSGAWCASMRPRQRPAGSMPSATTSPSSHAAQQRLRLLEKAFESSANPMIVASIERRPGGVIQYVNPAFERVTGYAPHEAIGRNCSFLQGDRP